MSSIEDDDKTVKSKSAVESLLKSKGPVAIMFFMRTCGHCIKTKPVWDKVAEDSTIDMKNVSSDNVPESLGITGFPTMVKVENGKIVKRIDGSRLDRSQLEKDLFGGGSRKHRHRRLHTRRHRRRSIRKRRN
jgi:hypothetical protein